MHGSTMKNRIEWPTFVLIVTTYAIFALGLWGATYSMGLAVLLLTIAGVLHSSLSHEALHGHPTSSVFVNAVLVTPALTLFVPYLRFRDTHIAHHHDENLTDPYDDPETNFIDPEVWERWPLWRKAVQQWNNTLLGRMIVGPIIGQIVFMYSDAKAILNGNRRIALSWGIHTISVCAIFWFMSHVSNVTFSAYALASYFSLSILKIRTFLEHRAHDHAAARTVIIEDRGLLALFFLNNNFHSVHHAHPKLAWYDLPKIYQSNKDQYLARNEGYAYASYKDVFAEYFVKSKDPVPHPLWSKSNRRV